MDGLESLSGGGSVIGALGLTLILISFGLLSSAAPRPSWNPARWRPLWKNRSHFTAAGWRLHLAGWSLFLIGVVLRLADEFQ